MNTLSSATDGLYPIRVAIKLTGLTADTIRVWERRYRAIEPARTEGNTRMYSAADIRRLIQLKEATVKGHRIHRIAGLSDEELARLNAVESPILTSAQEFSPAIEPVDNYRPLIDDYLKSIARFDVRRSQQLLSRAAAVMNTPDFLKYLLLPILRKTGHQWEVGKMGVAHEHLVSMQARALLVRMTELLSAQPGSFKIVITTPEGHLHEFGALVGALTAASRGFEPIYLGPNLPEADIIQAVTVSRANILLLSVLREMEEPDLEKFNAMLRRLSAHVETWVGIPGDHAALNRVAEVRYLTRFEDLDVMLTRQFV